MKLCVVILSGAADLPAPALNGETPLTAASLPALRGLAATGRVGGVLTAPAGAPVSTELCLASLLGVGHVPAGPLLAAALDEVLGPRETAFRMDLVNLFEGEVEDATAGGLPEREAEILVGALADELDSDQVRVRHGARWRALVMVGGGQAEGAETSPPATGGGGPRGPGSEVLRSFMERAAALLEEHEINTVRADLGENPANGIWIWGGGRPPKAPRRLEGVAVGGHPSFAGLARLSGLDLVSLPDAVAAAGGVPLTVVQVDGALDRSRQGDPAGKVAELEDADRRVIRPLVEEVIEREQGRLLVVASHVASSTDRRDLAGVVPFVLAGPGIKHLGQAAFDEEAAASADLVVEEPGGLLEFAGRV